MRFGLCLDFVIGSCKFKLAYVFNPLTLVSPLSFVVRVLRFLNSHVYDNVLYRTLAMPEWCKTALL